MTKQHEFRLGIIGGCMSYQGNIPHSLLYHRQLADRLLQNTGVRLHVDIARNFGRPYSERLDNLIADTKCDGILLHIRSSFAMKAGLFVIYYIRDTRKYSLHPVLLGKGKMGWEQFAATYLGNFRFGEENPPMKWNDQSPIQLGIVLKGESNRILGTMLGLGRWAINDEIKVLQAFLVKCSDVNMPVVVFGPPPTYPKYVLNYLCMKMNKRLLAVLSPLNIPCCCFNASPRHNIRHLMLKNGIHLNAEGHRFVADSLYDTIELWAKKKITDESS